MWECRGVYDGNCVAFALGWVPLFDIGTIADLMLTDIDSPINTLQLR